MAKQQLNNRVFGSEYMHWAKTSSAARFNLATSGLANRNLKELDVSLSELEITTEYGYGYPPLKYGLAERLQVPTEAIVTAAGTTFANHLAMAALIDPGDEVIIEQPTYEPLLALAKYLGAEVRRVPRRYESGFQIDLDELEQSISSRTRLIILTNLHNPSGIQISNDTLKQIGDIAKQVGARVLVDEVYLESFFEDRPSTAFHLGPQFIVTSSLTKAFGLSGLRCGWIVAEESLAQRMWLLNDLFASTPVHVGERLSVVALHQLDSLAAEASVLLKTNRELVGRFLDSRTDLEAIRPSAGTVVFPKVVRGSADAFCSLLARKYETSVVPGRFFEMPQHFRMGMGGDTETLEAGLERLGHALDES
jgi:aspartate/methionine/tyrosine aminotransferase